MSGCGKKVTHHFQLTDCVVVWGHGKRTFWHARCSRLFIQLSALTWNWKELPGHNIIAHFQWIDVWPLVNCAADPRGNSTETSTLKQKWACYHANSHCRRPVSCLFCQTAAPTASDKSCWTSIMLHCGLGMQFTCLDLGVVSHKSHHGHCGNLCLIVYVVVVVVVVVDFCAHCQDPSRVKLRTIFQLTFPRHVQFLLPPGLPVWLMEAIPSSLGDFCELPRPTAQIQWAVVTWKYCQHGDNREE